MSQLELHQSDDSGYEKTVFAEVLVPLPLPKSFTYRVPRDLTNEVQEGIRAIIPFGKKKIITGVIQKIHHRAPNDYEAKYIVDLLDASPIIHSVQFDFFKWVASYYMSTEGECLNIALPSGFKLSSESKIQLNPEFNASDSPYPLSNEEELTLKVIRNHDIISYNHFSEESGLKNSNKVIKSLLQKKAILLIEQLKDKYKPKKEKRIRLRSTYLAKELLSDLMNQLEKKPKQLELLLFYLQRVPLSTLENSNKRGIRKTDITHSELSSSSLKTLIKNKVFEEFEEVISRIEVPSDDAKATSSYAIKLSDYQQKAKNSIEEVFTEKDVCLLHGITGSGKTEIYLSFIEEVIESGSQALFLLPEIAITTQMIQRVKKIFGDRVGVYHSKFSDAERVEVWNGVANGTINFVLGVRSALFLPFNHLSLIVVDEEHESSYKQFDPAPRYHARDASVVLAHLHEAKVILGSATPSFESYYNARKGKYGLVELFKRYGKGNLPPIELVDMKKAKAKKQFTDDFSHTFLETVKSTVKEGKQAIIFQNRRGYAPYLQCETCGWIAECENCSVSLTYHMHQHELKCHYCGFRQKSPSSCLECESNELKMKGFGTEKIEDDLKNLVEDARVQRMDRDTTKKKYSYQQIIESFENGQTDILIGTQMVTKGLDFANVTMVGIVDADRLMFYPDFRAHERAFQLMLQVSGRAGRDAAAGKVLVQTFQKDHQLFKFLGNYDFIGFYNYQIRERNTFFYPPFSRLIKITLKGAEKNDCLQGAQLLYRNLLKYLGDKRVLPPHEPIISKIRNVYFMEVWIKLERNYPLSKTKAYMVNLINQLKQNSRFRKLRVIFDVDPQ